MAQRLPTRLANVYPDENCNSIFPGSREAWERGDASCPAGQVPNPEKPGHCMYWDNPKWQEYLGRVCPGEPERGQFLVPAEYVPKRRRGSVRRPGSSITQRRRGSVSRRRGSVSRSSRKPQSSRKSSRRSSHKSSRSSRLAHHMYVDACGMCGSYDECGCAASSCATGSCDPHDTWASEQCPRELTPINAEQVPQMCAAAANMGDCSSYGGMQDTDMAGKPVCQWLGGANKCQAIGVTGSANPMQTHINKCLSPESNASEQACKSNPRTTHDQRGTKSSCMWGGDGKTYPCQPTKANLDMWKLEEIKLASA